MLHKKQLSNKSNKLNLVKPTCFFINSRNKTIKDDFFNDSDKIEVDYKTNIDILESFSTVKVIPEL